MKTIFAAVAAVLVGAAAVAVAAAVCLLAPGYYAYLLGTLATTALVGIGLNVLLGLAGEVSLGQGGFLALGAYGVGILTTKAGLNFWEALPLAVLLVAAISAALSIPALRVTGPYLAMVTIAFGFIVESVSIEWRDLTGGASGLSGIPAPFGTGGTALLACGLCALSLILFHYFARSPLGLAMQALASAPAAARGVGISAVPVRTVAFVLGAVAAGLEYCDLADFVERAGKLHLRPPVDVDRIEVGEVVVGDEHADGALIFAGCFRHLGRVGA